VTFEIDENLPAEAAQILCVSGFVADTVADEDLSGSDDEVVATRSRSEDRGLVTLDLDFANIRAYLPGEHSGIIVLRVKSQDKTAVLICVRLVGDCIGKPKTGWRVVDRGRQSNTLSAGPLTDAGRLGVPNPRSWALWPTNWTAPVQRHSAKVCRERVINRPDIYRPECAEQ
jgi:predicted nuclease of predicted toxin-antitoxin system